MALPTSYDLRTIPGKLPPVRDQGTCGSCWTFGIYASLESALRPGDTFDASENNMKNTHGGDWTHCAGGNQYLGTAYLARWSGPVSETNDPYNPGSGTSPGWLANEKQVQEVLMLPRRTGPTDNDTIKTALTTYGAVTMAYYHDDAYYNAATASYYYSSSGGSNHEVAIVGWDDNYSATNFLSLPAGNGAFIVRNSWGTGWGDSGYFYLSYYDGVCGYRDLSVFENAEDLPASDVFTPFTTNYGFDYLGWVNSIGASSGTSWGANVFSSGPTEERLDAVGFYATAPGMSYELSVYRNPTPGSPVTGGTLETTQTGSTTYAGYYTVPLTTPVTLSPTDTSYFSIVVKFTTPGYNYPLPVEYAVGGYSSGATANAGWSYVSTDGTTWLDITTAFNSTADMCIRGYTNPGPPRLEWAGATGYETDGVDPDSGDPTGSASPTTFTFKVKYTDPSAELPSNGRGGDPLVARCVVQRRDSGVSWCDESRIDMTWESGYVATGAIYSCSTQLPSEVLKYRFLFQAANGTDVTGPPAIFQDGKPTISGPPHLCWSGRKGYEADGVSPDTGPVGTRFVFQVKYMDPTGDAATQTQVEIKRNGAAWRTLGMNAWGGRSDSLGRIYQRAITVGQTGTYEYRFLFADASGAALGDPTNWQSAPTITGVGMLTSLAALPTKAGAQVTFNLTGAANVTATVVNIAGRPIRTIVADRPLGAGLQTLVWDRKAESGLTVPAGLHIIRVNAKAADGTQSTALATLSLR
jgi:C1A family cysteine protease